MAILPEVVSKAFEKRTEPVVFATVDKNGMPNAIYASCVKKYDEGMIVIADNFFSKTRANILAGNKGSIVFIAPENKSYQIKGSIEYCKEGEIFDDMKKGWLASKYPGIAAVVINVEEAYSGAERLL